MALPCASPAPPISCFSVTVFCPAQQHTGTVLQATWTRRPHLAHAHYATDRTSATLLQVANIQRLPGIHSAQLHAAPVVHRTVQEVMKMQATGSLSTAKRDKIQSLTKHCSLVCWRAALLLQGVCLQGCFGVQEPVTAIFDWVTTSLRDPGLTYELITPGRRALPSSAAVGQADLAGAVLNFRCLSQTQRGYLADAAGRQVPFLSDALLAQAQAD